MAQGPQQMWSRSFNFALRRWRFRCGPAWRRLQWPSRSHRTFPWRVPPSPPPTVHGCESPGQLPQGLKIGPRFFRRVEKGRQRHQSPDRKVAAAPHVVDQPGHPSPIPDFEASPARLTWTRIGWTLPSCRPVCPGRAPVSGNRLNGSGRRVPRRSGPCWSAGGR